MTRKTSILFLACALTAFAGAQAPLRLASLAQGRPLRLASLAQGRPLRLASLAQGRPLRLASLARGRPLRVASLPQDKPLRLASLAQDRAAGWTHVVEGYRAALQKGGIVGSSLLVVRDGQILARQNEGLQNLDRREPVTDDTIYHWASITKTFTGIAIMQLRDRGLLSLDDPVVKYVPELKLAHNPFGDISQVKIRHLMSHSAGFRASSYSNPGVIFLGRIIQLLSGDDYEVYVAKNILMPLGMRSTFFDRAPYYLR